MKQITCPHCADTYPDFDVAHVCSKGPYAPKLKPKMNERIETLAKAAGYDMINKAAMRALGFDVEKFAELIVRECFQVVDDFGITQASNAETYLGESLNVSMKITEAAWKIKQHFGVEE